MASGAHLRSGLTLYTTSDDVQCHRVRMVLAAKGVAYERVLVGPGKPSADLLEINPDGNTPTLVDRDLVLHDTAVICEYLDERYPHPSLMPIDPLSRAQLRIAAVRIEKGWLVELGTIRAGGRSADAARKRLRKQLLAVLPLFEASRFLLSPDISLLDCLVAPMIWRLPWLGVNLGREGKPILDYGERLFRSQGFERSLMDEEKAMRVELLPG